MVGSVNKIVKFGPFLLLFPGLIKEAVELRIVLLCWMRATLNLPEFLLFNPSLRVKNSENMTLLSHHAHYDLFSSTAS